VRQRTGLDWTHKYSAIAAAVSSLGARQAYLDGELCGVFPDGITSFSMIQAASAWFIVAKSLVAGLLRPLVYGAITSPVPG
jgi:hypothetical protein